MSYGNDVEKPGLRPYAFVRFGMSFFSIENVEKSFFLSFFYTFSHGKVGWNV